MKKIYFSALVFGLLFSGCSVMHFKNGEVESAGPLHEEWHHNGIFTLVEFSPPVDLAGRCPGRNWSVITTKLSFVTGLVGGIDQAVTGLVIPGGLDLWSPQDVEWYCGEKVAGAAVPTDSTKKAPKEAASHSL